MKNFAAVFPVALATALVLALQGCKTESLYKCADTQDCDSGECVTDLTAILEPFDTQPGTCEARECSSDDDCNDNFSCQSSSCIRVACDTTDDCNVNYECDADTSECTSTAEESTGFVQSLTPIATNGYNEWQVALDMLAAEAKAEDEPNANQEISKTAGDGTSDSFVVHAAGDIDNDAVELEVEPEVDELEAYNLDVEKHNDFADEYMHKHAIIYTEASWGHKEKYYCNICMMYLETDASVEEHIASHSHLKNLALYNDDVYNNAQIADPSYATDVYLDSLVATNDPTAEPYIDPEDGEPADEAQVELNAMLGNN